MADQRAAGALSPLYPPLKGPAAAAAAQALDAWATEAAAAAKAGGAGAAPWGAAPPCEVCQAVSEVVGQDPRALKVRPPRRLPSLPAVPQACPVVSPSYGSKYVCP